MSSTWRYVSEAKGHLVEVYELLIGMPLSRQVRHLVGMNPDPARVEAEMCASDEWYERRVAALMKAVDVLNRYDVKQAILEWKDDAIMFLGKTPSARAKQKFHDDEDRILFLCVVLWYARVAIAWLESREDEGLLRGGSSYRDMTAMAATTGAWDTSVDASFAEILPEECSIPDNMDDDDPRVAAYQKWTYIPLGLAGF